MDKYQKLQDIEDRKIFLRNTMREQSFKMEQVRIDMKNAMFAMSVWNKFDPTVVDLV